MEVGNAAPFERDSPSTLPAVFEKMAMGEFAGRLGPAGTIRIDPAWVRARIVTAGVPILGNVTCNRAFIPQLRAALSAVEEAGLAPLDPPVRVRGLLRTEVRHARPHAADSHHAWGSALDLNAPENRFGSKPTMDRRIVAIFTSLGFQWGGAWLIPRDALRVPHLAAGALIPSASAAEGIAVAAAASWS